MLTRVVLLRQRPLAPRVKEGMCTRPSQHAKAQCRAPCPRRAHMHTSCESAAPMPSSASRASGMRCNWRRPFAVRA